MNKLLKIVVIVLLLALLVVVRIFEDVLFYDPLLDFFKHDHSTKALPEFETVRLLVHLVFRFILNTLISLIILWVVLSTASHLCCYLRYFVCSYLLRKKGRICFYSTFEDS
jgi:exosortase F-associated protein